VGTLLVPVIDSIEPAQGPVSSIVTIRGSGFAATDNTVTLQAAFTNAIWLVKSKNPSADGTSISIQVGPMLYSECHYAVPPCDFSYIPMMQGEYFVTVQVASATSNIKVFTVVEPSPTPEVGPCTCELGDVDCDASVTIVDAMLIARYYVGYNPVIQNCAADVNKNGTIDIIDALQIAQCYVGLISCNF
jgi:hypothetical protein